MIEGSSFLKLNEVAALGWTKIKNLPAQDSVWKALVVNCSRDIHSRAALLQAQFIRFPAYQASPLPVPKALALFPTQAFCSGVI
jgi:hypothetical protein